MGQNWQRDKAELPRLDRTLHACRADAAKAERARPPISDGALGRAVALFRYKRGIVTDHWTPLELKALPDVTFIVRQIDGLLTIPLQCPTNLICRFAQARWWREAFFVLHLCCPWVDPQGAFLGFRGQRLQLLAVRHPQKTPSRSWRHLG